MDRQYSSWWAGNLLCPACGEVNQTNYWPLHGDRVTFFYKKEPGNYYVNVHCPHCNNNWYVVWEENPGPVRRLDVWIVEKAGKYIVETACGQTRYKCNSCGWLQAHRAYEEALASKGVMYISGLPECLKCGSTDLVDLWNPPTEEEKEKKAAIKRLPERSKLIELIKEYESVQAQRGFDYLERMEQIGEKIRAVGEKLEKDGGYDLMFQVCTSLEWKRWHTIVSRYWDGVSPRWRY